MTRLAVVLGLIAAAASAMAEDRTLSGLTQLINPGGNQGSYPPIPSSVYGVPQEQSSYGVPSQEVHGWKTDENQGFTVQSGYEGFILPTGPAPEGFSGLGALGGVALGTKLLTALLPFPFNKIALLLETKVGFWLLGLMLLVLIGGATTTAVCALTPLCTISFLGLGAFSKEQTRALITQDRLDQATQFLYEAIDKFSKIQARIAKEVKNKKAREQKEAETREAKSLKEPEAKSVKEPEGKFVKEPEAKSVKEPEAKSVKEEVKEVNSSPKQNSVK